MFMTKYKDLADNLMLSYEVLDRQGREKSNSHSPCRNRLASKALVDIEDLFALTDCNCWNAVDFLTSKTQHFLVFGEKLCKVSQKIQNLGKKFQDF